MGAFSIYVCGLGDVRVLFLEKGESRHATALRGARSRFEGPIGSFSMYVCGLSDVRALFFRENTPAGSDSGLRPPQGQSRFWNRWGLFLCTFVV